MCGLLLLHNFHACKCKCKCQLLSWTCHLTASVFVVTMCVKDGEQVGEDHIEKNVDNNRRVSWPLHCDLLRAHMDNKEKDSSFRIPSDQISVVNSSPVRNSFPSSFSFFCSFMGCLFFSFFLYCTVVWICRPLFQLCFGDFNSTLIAIVHESCSLFFILTFCEVMDSSIFN